MGAAGVARGPALAVGQAFRSLARPPSRNQQAESRDGAFDDEAGYTAADAAMPAAERGMARGCPRRLARALRVYPARGRRERARWVDEYRVDEYRVDEHRSGERHGGR